MKVRLHTFFTSVPYGSELSASHSGHFTPGKELPHYLQKSRLNGPTATWGVMTKTKIPALARN